MAGLQIVGVGARGLGGPRRRELGRNGCDHLWRDQIGKTTVGVGDRAGPVEQHVVRDGCEGTPCMGRERLGAVLRVEGGSVVDEP